MFKTIKRIFYKWKDDITFHPQYTYVKIKNNNIDKFEFICKLRIGLGWERVGDVKANYFTVYVWMRKRNIQ